ncbi:RHOMBOID-like protein 8 [Tripterygium wilfordii]|uniref:RHOMBOID-like protein 8 n=1 Tax=Tripterygium wilfordii TaxID=458696 RepID=UPI0018F7E905|nr:RHOMBOID-like protein 8 [Tripterygium wilfordii]
MEKPPKLHAEIEIKSPPPPPFPLDFPDNADDQKTPFFKSRSRRRRSDTWAISVFVILHIGAFLATMIVNDCWRNSHGDCALESLGRFSFQPLTENPFLGPSASALDKMGALQQSFLAGHQDWRLLTCPCLHAGAFHIIINLSSVIFLGSYLEQEFGPLRTGIIYVLSAFFGSLIAALFVRNSPVVCSSGALFGLVGATLSALIRNWKFYTAKYVALAILCALSAINFGIGLLPYVDNFANIGGFLSGVLLGFVLLFNPQIREVALNKGGFYDYGVKSSTKLKEKLDRPVMRSVSLLLFTLVVAGTLVAVLQGLNVNHYCRWCRYIDCIPSARWSCNSMTTSCETMVSDAQLTLTCTRNGNFRIFPFTNISEARTRDICTMICS